METNFSSKFSATIRGFRTNINDQIEYKSSKYINSAAGLALKQSGINSQFQIKQYDYKLDLFSSFLSSDKVGGAPQLRRPEKTYGFNLNKKFINNEFGNFNVNLKYNHYGKHFDTHSTSFATVELDSTDILDISLTKNYGLYDFQLNITNLLDEGYQRPHGYSQDGRLFNIAIKTNF